MTSLPAAIAEARRTGDDQTADWLEELERLRAERESLPKWRPFHEAPTYGKKIIIGTIAKFVPYKNPKNMGGQKGRWQIRDDYGKWRNCERQKDYWLDGYVVDAPLPQPKENENEPLWAIHVIGPDDIIAVNSLSEAIDKARELNAGIEAIESSLPDDGLTPKCFASVIEWTDGPCRHAKLLETQEPSNG